jgi:hypothetical protein
MLHSTGKFFNRESIQYVLSGEPRAAGLHHTVPDFLHVGGVVRIGANDDFDAALLSHAEMAVAQVEPIGICI